MKDLVDLQNEHIRESIVLFIRKKIVTIILMCFALLAIVALFIWKNQKSVEDNSIYTSKMIDVYKIDDLEDQNKGLEGLLVDKNNYLLSYKLVGNLIKEKKYSEAIKVLEKNQNNDFSKSYSKSIISALNKNIINDVKDEYLLNSFINATYYIENDKYDEAYKIYEEISKNALTSDNLRNFANEMLLIIKYNRGE